MISEQNKASFLIVRDLVAYFSEEYDLEFSPNERFDIAQQIFCNMVGSMQAANGPKSLINIDWNGFLKMREGQ